MATRSGRTCVGVLQRLRSGLAGIEQVRVSLRAWQTKHDIIEFDVSGARVELAAR